MQCKPRSGDIIGARHVMSPLRGWGIFPRRVPGAYAARLRDVAAARLKRTGVARLLSQFENRFNLNGDPAGKRAGAHGAAGGDAGVGAEHVAH